MREDTDNTHVTRALAIGFLGKSWAGWRVQGRELCVVASLWGQAMPQRHSFPGDVPTVAQDMQLSVAGAACAVGARPQPPTPRLLGRKVQSLLPRFEAPASKSVSPALETMSLIPY